MIQSATLPFDEVESSERWLPVVGWEGLYLVSSLGRVKALPRQTTTGVHGGRRDVLAQKMHRNGYLCVRLNRDGTRKRYMVHHLVADAFLGPLPPGRVRRHKNGIKTDCAASNLEFGTHSENVQDSLRHGALHPAKGNEHCCAKLNEDKVREMRRRWDAGGISQQALADEYGVKQPTVQNVLARITWKHVA